MAALLRIPGIEARGQFDADQGHDMATLVAFTRDGVVPLLGPKTSVGEFHHGAFYYFLLAPSAAISGGDPVAVTLFIALLGIAAVALTWWLGRSIGGRVGGPVAGLVAGTLLAVSPGAIEESTFIWNPNPIGFFAVLSLAAAWKAWRSGRAGWWALAIAAAGAVTQLHVLGVVFLVAMLGLGLVELRRDRGVAAGLVTGLLIVGLLFLPLLLYELQNGFSETRAVLAYLSSDTGALGDPVGALAFTLLRVVGWPLVGLVTDVPQLAGVMLAVTVGVVVARPPDGGRRRGDRAALARRDPRLQHDRARVRGAVAPARRRRPPERPLPRLPRPDRGPAARDPGGPRCSRAPRRPGGTAAGPSRWLRCSSWGSAIAALELTPSAGSRRTSTPTVAGRPRRPPASGSSGDRRRPVRLAGLPEFKLPDAIGFPIEHAGGQVYALADVDGLSEFRFPTVVVCDRLFEDAIGRPAAARPRMHSSSPDGDRLGPGRAPPALVDRFDASPRTSVSIYR